MKKIIDRAKNILLNPKAEWALIATEEGRLREILRYTLFISLVPAIAMFIGYAIIGIPMNYAYFRMSFMSAFFSAAIFYLLTVTGVIFTAVVTGIFCNYFSIYGNWKDYLKLSVYSATAPILANIFYLIPVLRGLKILGFYGCVTLFIGLPLLIKIPKDKELQFVVTIIVSSIVIATIFFGLVDQFVGPIYMDVL